MGTADSDPNDPPLSLPPTRRNSFQFTMGLTYTLNSKDRCTVPTIAPRKENAAGYPVTSVELLLKQNVSCMLFPRTS